MVNLFRPVQSPSRTLHQLRTRLASAETTRLVPGNFVTIRYDANNLQSRTSHVTFSLDLKQPKYYRFVTPGVPYLPSASILTGAKGVTE